MPATTVLIDHYSPLSAIRDGVDWGYFGALVVCDNTTYTKKPPYKGTGYIAGESPDGLVTFNGAPAVRTLDLFDRATNILCMTTVSAADGTYRFDGLNLSMIFDVLARGSSTTENDLILSQVSPEP